ncbi:hypothetical protein QAD02_024041 [Eretmocerus hayati]|uniref:Uncharacterized protein n=1 Tax=Eretmocerus hayati TaxID=131215 RepID=A0ACC2PZ94_9HYME|nr:hypothetical protein QAD02_024041 [Eretmocerus hayati]
MRPSTRNYCAQRKNNLSQIKEYRAARNQTSKKKTKSKKKKVPNAKELERRKLNRNLYYKEKRQILKNDPEAYEESCRKERERKRKAKLAGKIKGIEDLTPREARAKRKKQREWQRVSRARRGAPAEAPALPAANELEMTNNDWTVTEPANVDLVYSLTEPELLPISDLPGGSLLPLPGGSPLPIPGGSRGSLPTDHTRRVAVMKENAKSRRRRCYNENKALKVRNGALENKVMSLRMRLLRVNKQNEPQSSSPRSTTKRFLRSKSTTSEDVQNRMELGETIMHQLRESYTQMDDEKAKRLMRSALSGNIVRGGKKFAEIRENVIPLERVTTPVTASEILCTSRATKHSSLALKATIEEFYLGNSIIDPGKKKFKTINGEKVQVQYLSASIIDLLTKFCQESGTTVAYSTFWKYKPINCIEPKLSERDTCACPKHMNFFFLIKALHDEKVITENSVFQVINACVCENSTTVCLSRQCTNCQGKLIKLNRENIQLSKMVSHPKWITKKEERISGKTKKAITVSLTDKVMVTNDIQSLIQEFQIN